MAQPIASTLRFTYASLWIFSVVGVVAGVALSGVKQDPMPMCLLVLPGILVLVAAQVCGGILLYRCWRCLHRHAPRFDSRRELLDSGAAVALTFTPFVNLIGLFFSILPLAGELNWLAKSAGVPRRASDGLGHALPVLAVCGLIPLFGRVCLVAFGGLLPVFIWSCSGLAEEIESRLAPSVGQVAPAG
jgi:hypothetical protein